MEEIALQTPEASPPPVEEAPPADPTVEGAPEQAEEPPKPAEQDAFERKWLQSQQLIKRQERELRKAMARAQELEAKLGPLTELDKLLDEDPLEALKRKGRTYDDLTKRVLESEQLSPEEQAQLELRQKIEALEKERAEERKSAEERQAKQEREAHVEAITKAVDANPEFAFVASFGLSGALYDRMQEFVTENGYAPSPEEQGEIAMQLETEVREAVTSNIEGLLKRSPEVRQQVLDLIKGLEPSQEKPDQQAEETVERPRTKAAPRTITREHLSAVETRKETTGLSLEEKRARGRERSHQRLGIG